MEEKVIEQHGMRLKKLEQKAEQFDTRLNRLEKSNKKTDKKIEELSGKIDGVKTTSDYIKGKVDIISKVVTNANIYERIKWGTLGGLVIFFLTVIFELMRLKVV